MGIGLLILILVVVAIVGYIITIYNGLIKLKNNIKKAWANIDVLLKQRSDELPKLINTVKGYMKHEKEVLENLTKARTNFLTASTFSETAAADNMITGALKSLFAVAENYPNLKANENFMQLQNRISGIENEIADRREFYNDSVNQYNIRIHSIPDVIIARMLGYTNKEMFEVSEADKKDVKVNFD